MIIPSIFNNCGGGSETHLYNPTTKPITLGGMANPFLSAAMVSTERVVGVIELMKKQIEMTLFSTERQQIGVFNQMTLREE